MVRREKGVIIPFTLPRRERQHFNIIDMMVSCMRPGEENETPAKLRSKMANSLSPKGREGQNLSGPLYARWWSGDLTFAGSGGDDRVDGREDYLE